MRAVERHRPWYRPYEADVRRIAAERGMGMFGVGFVHHPMKANTAGEELATVALVENLKQFVESNDDKVAQLQLRSPRVCVGADDS
jgi:hypothetical protein